MAIPLYLAMTGAEVLQATALPSKVAWLSCLFSPYGVGLSNLPKRLPPDSLLILSDRTPIYGHDPQRIYAQLRETVAEFSCCGLLLDFQASKNPELERLTEVLLSLPCPVAVSENYGQNLSCPIFLPPVPPDTPIEDYLSPWQDREIWLEVALDRMDLQVTEQGVRPWEFYSEESPALPFYDEALCCHYGITLSDSITFHLQRQPPDIQKLLERGEKCGVAKALGLYQELG